MNESKVAAAEVTPSTGTNGYDTTIEEEEAVGEKARLDLLTRFHPKRAEKKTS